MKMRLFTTALLIFLSACGRKTEETKPIRKDVTEAVFASGVLEANNTYNLTAQVDGYLVTINFNEGDVVTKGMELAVVDNKENRFNSVSATGLYDIALRNTQSTAPLLLQAQHAIATAKEKMGQDKLQVERYKRLLENNSIARLDYENATLTYETSKNNYESAVANYQKLQQDAEQQIITNKAQKKINETAFGKNVIQAVVNGKVYQKLKQTGDYVKRGDVIAVIGDENFIYAKVNVDEANIRKIKIGQSALIKLNTDKEKAYRAEVWQILPSFDESQQSFVCKLKFTESLDFTIVKTQLQANIIADSQKNALVIPRNYLDLGGRVQIKGEKDPVKVKTKFIGSQWVQITDGVDENTVLVTENIAGNNIQTSEIGSTRR
jgi:HlyD family secretion protein